jgi:hypothetical protein
MKRLFILIAAVAIANTGLAAQYFNLSAVPDIAIFDSSETIEGVTLSIWGENETKGLTLGFFNETPGDSKGLSFGLGNCADNYRGAQLGIVNHVSGDLDGYQGAFFNCTEGEVRGAQIGYVNYAGSVKGAQIGLVNWTKSLDKGLQIGLVNFAENNDWFSDLPDALAPAFVFVNWRF